MFCAGTAGGGAVRKSTSGRKNGIKSTGLYAHKDWHALLFGRLAQAGSQTRLAMQARVQRDKAGRSWLPVMGSMAVTDGFL